MDPQKVPLEGVANCALAYLRKEDLSEQRKKIGQGFACTAMKIFTLYKIRPNMGIVAFILTIRLFHSEQTARP
jgi:hypothetical protein